MQEQLNYKNSIITYRQFGNGPQLLFAFHGYGEDANSFAFLEESLGKQFTIIAIDFPFHGNTLWNDDLNFSATDLVLVLQQLNKNQLPVFSILAFSMGGRVALDLLQHYPTLIQHLVLIAPDGLHHNFWHWFSTHTFIGNRLFRYTMHHPAWLFGLMKFFTSAGLFNKSIFNFVHYYLDEKESRIILYKRWTTMRSFKPDLMEIRKIIASHHKHIRLLFGRHDKIIITKRGRLFARNMQHLIYVQEINAGHQLLRQKYTDEIVAMFNR